MVQYEWGANKKKAHFSPYFSKYMYVAPALKMSRKQAGGGHDELIFQIPGYQMAVLPYIFLIFFFSCCCTANPTLLLQRKNNTNFLLNVQQ